MTRLSILAPLLFTALAAAEGPPDRLRLADGELAGRFDGIDDRGMVTWNRDDAAAPLRFTTDKVRQIVLGGRSALRTDADTSHVTLINEDRIPGRIEGLDETHLTLDTGVAGTLLIRREHLDALKPNPFGGRLIYAGPFDREGWKTAGPGDDSESEDAEDRDWRQRGSHWYNTRGSDVLMLPGLDMPGKSVFRFKAEWRNRPPIEIALHADFHDPAADGAEDGEDGERRSSSQSNSERFGNALVMSLHSSYARLSHCGYDEEGEAFSHQVNGSTNRVNFEDVGEADFELRSDVSTGLVSFFVNGRFAMQWNVGDHLAAHDLEFPRGGGIAFVSRGGAKQPLRISEIMVAEWNGVPDSARSLENEDFDIILLTNGTDRFSGLVRSIANGELLLEGRYADLEIPLREIAEIQFAKSSHADHEPSHADQIAVFYQPIGRISGIPTGADASTLRLRSTLAGELELQLDAASLIEFQAADSFLNFWDEDL